MGRIIGYQYDNDIKDDDAWIGTEATSRRTKQYTAQAVADYLNINGSISIVGQMSYKYSTTPLNGIGTFAVFGGGPNTVAFSAITKLTLSNQDISEQRVVEYLDLLVGSDMIISESGQISTFGYYSIDGYVVNATNSDYYDLSVTFKSGNGAMEADKVYETQNFTLAAEENISTLQTTIDSGNTYQANPSNPLWTWGPGEITTTSTSFTSLLSSKRFKTTLIADGSYTDVLPNQLIFNNALGNETSITPNTALSSSIDLQWPSSSGTLALTTDITDSPWDTVLGGINYAGGNVGVGATSPSAPLDVATISSGPVAKFVNTLGTGGAGVVIQAGVATSSSILTLFDYQNNERLRVRGDGNVGIGTTSPGAALEVVGGGLGARLVSINTTALEVQGGANAQDIARFKNSVGNAKFVIDTNGNVGIGTSSPARKLEVYDSSSSIISQFRSGSGTSSFICFANTGSAADQVRIGSISTNLVLSTNYTERMRINSSGNVGIGTTSPVSKLELQDGTFTVDNGNINVIAGGISATRNSANNTGLVVNQQGTADILNLLDNGTEVLTVIDGGNVGIGTTSPSEKLDVVGNIKLRGTNNLTIGSTSSGGNFSLSSGIRGFNFANNNGDLVRIDSDGNVGIGTTSPSTNLEVVTSDPANGIKGTTNTGIIWGSFINTNSNTFPVGKITLRYGATETASILARSNEMRLGNSQSNMTFYASSSERMRISPTGNVGIGTTSPSTKLDVRGDITITNANGGNPTDAGSLYFTEAAGVWGSTQYGFRINQQGTSNYLNFQSANTTTVRDILTLARDTGNVGIGTTAPGYSLHIADADATINLAKTDGDQYLRLVGGSGTNSDVIAQRTLTLQALSGNVLLQPTGNVGIGTTSPTSKLDVAGGDIELNDAAAGIIMRSPDGTKYRITVANGGTLTVTAV